MNQILNTKLLKKISKYKYFKSLFFFSILTFLFIIIITFLQKCYLAKQHNKSFELSNNYKLYQFYSNKHLNKTYEITDILGNIIIPKLNLSYPFFYGYNEEFLKISPCRFSGNMPPAKSNLCILGHNYNDNRFFGNLNKLQNNDVIIIENNNNYKYYYYVFNKYEVDENDLSALESSANKSTITLITCINSNNKRLIVNGILNKSEN